MTRYLTVEQVERLHDRHIGAGVRDHFMLESAVERPQASAGGEDAYPTLHEKAGALFESLAQNQPFFDGNKRTAVLAVHAFYALNGFYFDADDTELIYLAIDLALHEADAAKCAERFEHWARPIPSLADDAEYDDDATAP